MNWFDGAKAGQRLSTVGQTIRQRALPVLFGDRLGMTLFLGVVAVLAVIWRVGFFINDSFAIANTLLNLADGHFEITFVEYSMTLGTQPGLYQHGNQVFGRNYGAAALSLPFYWLLEGASTVVDLRVLLAGGWSLLVAGFAAQLGQILDRRGVVLGGTLFALVGFLGNLALASPLDPRWTGLLALQLLTIVAAAVVAVSLYRLLGSFHGPRVGIAAGILSVFSLPIVFWATVPKRHVLSAAFIAVVVLAFARSRRSESSIAPRALAYATVGIFAWLHPAEALVVMAGLVPVDLATAPRTGRRELAVIAVAFALSLIPFVVTNVAITGSPLETPRMLPALGDGVEIGSDGSVVVDSGQGAGTQSPATGGSSTNGGGSSTSGSMDSGSSGLSDTVGGLIAMAMALPGAVAGRVGDLWSYVSPGIDIVRNEHGRLWHIFVRSGRIPGVRYYINDQEAVELAVLEAAPLLAVLIGAPLVAGRIALERGRDAFRQAVAERANTRYGTDLFVVVLVTAFTLLYLPRLPLFSQITVRYLVPVLPLALYGVFRLPPIRRGLQTNWRQFALTYAIGSVVGLIAVSGLLGLIDPAIGEAMQFHALLNLLGATTLLAGVVFAVLLDCDVDARLFGGVAAAATVFYGLAGLEYFAYGDFVLPLSELLSTLLGLF